MKRSPTSATAHGSSNPSDKVIAQKDSNDLDANQLSPGLQTTPVSPYPPATPDTQVPDSEELSKDYALSPAFCKERSPSFNTASDEGPNERC